jgi:hypothetical protein
VQRDDALVADACQSLWRHAWRDRGHPRAADERLDSPAADALATQREFLLDHE